MSAEKKNQEHQQHQSHQGTQKKDNQIYQEAFYLLYYGLLLLLILRTIILNHPLESTWDISLMFLGASIYILIRFLSAGRLHEAKYEGEQGFKFKKVARNGLAATVVFSLLMVLAGTWSVSGAEDLLKVAVGSIIFFALWVLFPWISYKISRKKAVQ